MSLVALLRANFNKSTEIEKSETGVWQKEQSTVSRVTQIDLNENSIPINQTNGKSVDNTTKRVGRI